MPRRQAQVWAMVTAHGAPEVHRVLHAPLLPPQRPLPSQPSHPEQRSEQLVPTRSSAEPLRGANGRNKACVDETRFSCQRSQPSF